MSLEKRARTPEMRRGRERLTVRDPRVEHALAGLNIDNYDVEETRRFGNRLMADARRWMMRGGFADRGRIGKGDAHRLYVQAFSGRGGAHG